MSLTQSHKTSMAIQAARMYYYHNLTTEAIADELNVSRSTISRLLSYAKAEGLVEIHVVDPSDAPGQLERIITETFGLTRVHVVAVPEIAGEAEWLERVAQYAANYLNSLFHSDMTLGIAWGTTMTAISRHLLHKPTHNSQIVQLNGAGNTQSMGIEYANQIIMQFAQNYDLQAHLFPVPTFFDYPETKRALWQEGSIRHILEMQKKADLLLYSIGSVNAGIPSHVYSGGYLEESDYGELKKCKIVGDIATVFFREDGTFNDISINERASGPDLTLFQQKKGLCVVSGLAKVHGLHSAIKGKLIKELIVDEPTARNLIKRYVI